MLKRREEIANWVTHAIGLCLSLAGFIGMLIIIANEFNLIKTISIVVYGIALISLYLFSTLYHLSKSEKLKRRFQIADHSAIYIKIAGTYTPFLLLTLKGSTGLLMMIAIWGLAIAGIIFKLIFKDKYIITSTIIYLAMGWLALVLIKPLFQELHLIGFLFLTAGGLSYTAGVIFFLWEKLPYSHPIWHIFVMAGSTFHYLAILYFVI